VRRRLQDYRPPSGSLEEAINAQYGDLDGLVAKFNAAAAGVQGSGWAWLAWSPEAQGLAISTTPNQDPLQPTTGLVPLLGVDVW
jgi:Fe-Mn family superoxide dismutase